MAFGFGGRVGRSKHGRPFGKSEAGPAGTIRHGERIAAVPAGWNDAFSTDFRPGMRGDVETRGNSAASCAAFNPLARLCGAAESCFILIEGLSDWAASRRAAV